MNLKSLLEILLIVVKLVGWLLIGAVLQLLFVLAIAQLLNLLFK
jgi:hypothetical protein